MILGEALCKFPTTFLCDVLKILNETNYNIFPSQTCGALSISLFGSIYLEKRGINMEK